MSHWQCCVTYKHPPAYTNTNEMIEKTANFSINNWATERLFKSIQYPTRGVNRTRTKKKIVRVLYFLKFVFVQSCTNFFFRTYVHLFCTIEYVQLTYVRTCKLLFCTKPKKSQFFKFFSKFWKYIWKSSEKFKFFSFLKFYKILIFLKFISF